MIPKLNYQKINFEENYKFYNERIFLKLENNLKKYFLLSHKNDKSYGSTKHELIYSILPSIVKKKTDKFSKLLDFQFIFRTRDSEYYNNQINNIFSNEITIKFKQLDKIELPLNYNLNQLLIEITLLEVIKEVIRLLEVNSDLFQLIYELNTFENFKIVNYNLPLNKTELYRSLYVLKHKEQYTIDNETDSLYDYAYNSNEKHKVLDASQKVLLIEKLILNSHRWDSIDNRKKAYVISRIIDRSTDNIRKRLNVLDKIESDFTSKESVDNKLTDIIINKLG